MIKINKLSKSNRIIIFVCILVSMLVFLMQLGTSNPSINEKEDIVAVDTDNNDVNNNAASKNNKNKKGTSSSAVVENLIKSINRNNNENGNSINTIIDGCQKQKQQQPLTNTCKNCRSWPSFLSEHSRKQCGPVLQSIEEISFFNPDRVLEKEERINQGKPTAKLANSLLLNSKSKNLKKNKKKSGNNNKKSALLEDEESDAEKMLKSRKNSSPEKALKDRRPSSPFITGDGFRGAAKFIFDEVTIATWEETGMKNELMKWVTGERHSSHFSANENENDDGEAHHHENNNNNNKKNRHQHHHQFPDPLYSCQDLRWSKNIKSIVFDHHNQIPDSFSFRSAPRAPNKDSMKTYWKEVSERMVDLSEDAYVKDYSRVMPYLRFDCLKYGDSIFVQTHLLDKFIDEVVPILQKRYDVYLDVCERGVKTKKQLGRSPSSDEINNNNNNNEDNTNSSSTLEQMSDSELGCGEKLKERIIANQFPAFALITHNSDYSSPFDSSNTRGIKSDPEKAKFEKQIEKLILSPLLLRWFGQNLVVSPTRQKAILSRFDELHPTTAYPFHLIEEAKRFEAKRNSGKIRFGEKFLKNPKHAHVINKHLSKMEKQRQQKLMDEGLNVEEVEKRDFAHINHDLNSGHEMTERYHARYNKEEYNSVRKKTRNPAEIYPNLVTHRKNEDDDDHDHDDIAAGERKNKRARMNEQKIRYGTTKPPPTLAPRSKSELELRVRNAEVLEKVHENPKRDLNPLFGVEHDDDTVIRASNDNHMLFVARGATTSQYFVAVKFLKAKMIPIPIGIENRYNRYGKFVSSAYALAAGCTDFDLIDNEHVDNNNDGTFPSTQQHISPVAKKQLQEDFSTLERENFDQPLIAFSMKTNKREREDALHAMETNFNFKFDSRPTATATTCTDATRALFDRIRQSLDHPYRSKFKLAPLLRTPKDKKNFETVLNYLARLKCHGFTLSPHGHGIDTHRIWEALYTGSIPITSVSAMDDQLLSQLPVFVASSSNNNDDDKKLLPSLSTYDDYEYFFSSNNRNNKEGHPQFYEKGTFAKVVTKENLKKYWCKNIKGIVEPSLLINAADTKAHRRLYDGRFGYKRGLDLFFKYSMNLPVAATGSGTSPHNVNNNNNNNDDDENQNQNQQKVVHTGKLYIAEMKDLQKRRRMNRHEEKLQEMEQEHHQEEEEHREKIVIGDATHRSNDEHAERHSRKEKARADAEEGHNKMSEADRIPKFSKFNHDLLDMSFWAAVVTMPDHPMRDSGFWE